MIRLFVLLAFIISSVAALAQGVLTNIQTATGQNYHTINGDANFNTTTIGVKCYWTVYGPDNNCTQLTTGQWSQFVTSSPSSNINASTGVVTSAPGAPPGVNSFRLADTNPANTFASVSIGCTTSTCTVDTLLAPTFTAGTGTNGAFVYITGSSVLPGLNGQTFPVTSSSTTSPFSYTFPIWKGLVNVAFSQTADTGLTTTLSSNWIPVWTEGPTGVGKPVATLPTGVTQATGFPNITYNTSTFDTNFPTAFNPSQISGTDLVASCPGGVGDVTAFQNQLNTLTCGQNIKIPVPCTFTLNGNQPASLHFPVRSCSTYSYIYSANWASLPSPGTRINPATDAVNMPVFDAVSNLSALAGMEFDAGTNYWRFVGIEFTHHTTGGKGNCYYQSYPTGGLNGCLISFAISGQAVNTHTVDHIIYDRVYAVNPANYELEMFLTMGGQYMASLDSYYQNVYMKSQDASALGPNGYGPYRITNNYIDSALGTFFAGQTHSDLGVPSDIIYNHNHVIHPIANMLNGWDIKNLGECKSCQRILFDHNTFENEWNQSGQWFAYAAFPRIGYGNAPVVSNVTVTNNWYMNITGGVTTAPCDPTVIYQTAFSSGAGVAPVAPTGTVTCGSNQYWTVINNLFTWCNPTSSTSCYLAGQGANNIGYLQSTGMQDLDYEHNTQYAGYPILGQYSMAINQNAIFPAGGRVPHAITHNEWIRYNVLPRQLYSANGGGGILGQSGTVQTQIGDPPGSTTTCPTTPDNGPACRFNGNLFGLFTDTNGSKSPNSIPSGNNVGCSTCTYPDSPSWTYSHVTGVNVPGDNYALVSPNLAATQVDGYQPGVAGVVGEPPQPACAAAPVVTAVTLPVAAIGESYSYGLLATCGVPPYSTWAGPGTGSYPVWTGTGGTAFSLTATTGVMTGTPGAGNNGTATFQVTVNDSQPVTSAAQSFTLTTNTRLTATPQSLPGCISSFGYPGATLGYNGGTTGFRWVTPPPSGALPPGLTLSASGGITGTCSAGAGTYTFTGQITDNGIADCTGVDAPACQSYSIVVSPVMSVSTTSLAPAQVGVVYNAAIAAAGGTLPYTYALTTGSLCCGLTFNTSTGVIGGTPTSSATLTNLIFTVTDSASHSASSGSLTLTINPAANPVVVNLTQSGITTPTIIGTSYTLSLASAASGGTPPYTWTLASGSLPPGIVIQNNPTTGWQLFGTSTHWGTYNFTLQATDSVGTAATGPATGQYQIQVNSQRGCGINVGSLKGACD